MEINLRKNFEVYLHGTGELSTWIAMASFAVGTTLFGIYHFISTNENILLFGLIYVIVVFLLNLIVFLNLCILFYMKPHHREYFAIKIMIVLANLPIAGLYLTIIFNHLFYFLSTNN